MNPKFLSIAAAMALVSLVAAPAQAQLAPYSQDFEGMDAGQWDVLHPDGWLVFGNVFPPFGGYLYGYGTFPAPNHAGGFCGLAVGEGGAEQGDQQIVVYSDYNNWQEHVAGNLVEANVFQERVLVTADVGKTWVFSFDAKAGDIAPPATAQAFIKTLNPANNYALTNLLVVDTTSLPSTWGTYEVSITIDPSLDGQVLQFGFSNLATNWTPTGVFYDNISFTEQLNYDSLGACIADLKAQNCSGLRGAARAACNHEQIGACHDAFGVPSAHAD
jgi:hypothetical protein